jgi:hypothetical protein
MIIQDKAIIAVKSLRNNVIFMPASESNRRTCYNLPGMQDTKRRNKTAVAAGIDTKYSESTIKARGAVALSTAPLARIDFTLYLLTLFHFSPSNL